MFPNRTDFWVRKIEDNMARDQRVNATLRADGWRVIRFWASDVLADPHLAAGTVAAINEDLQTALPRHPRRPGALSTRGGPFS